MSRLAPSDDQQPIEPNWRDCLEETIGYYQSCLDHRLVDYIGPGKHPKWTDVHPQTPRDYFQLVRGWNDDVIETARLGYAPPTTEIVSHLRDKGFSADDLRATGLFNDALRPRWQGRYVFPHLDIEGRPTYAVSRAISESGHSADRFDWKYDNVAHSHERVKVEPGAYGLHSLKESDPVIIAEGIPDAISAHQAGWSCVAPGGTHFQQDVFERLVEQFHALDVPRIYVIADADQIGSHLSEHGDEPLLEIEQHGTGLKGAYATATALVDKRFDVYLTVVPQINDNGLDLDEFLQEGWGRLGILQRSAVPPDQHRASRGLKKRTQSPTETDYPSVVESSGGDSGLYDLQITDVLGVDVGYRGVNPLGHIGESKTYFAVEGEDRAHDFKRDATYNARTYLLCEAGERIPSHPTGSLSNRDIFVAWREAKRQRLLPENDPIPARALTYVALDNDLCSEADLEDGWRLPGEVYREGLTLVEEEHGLEPGRASSEATEHTESSAQANATEITLQSARERCERTIVEAIRDGDDVIVDALPAMGKSSSVSRAVQRTDVPVTVLTARSDLYEQHQAWCEEQDLSHYVLPAFHRDCPTAAGKHGDEWKDRVMGLYERGVWPRTLHQRFQETFGEPLPCTEEGPCSYETKWDFDPDECDVLIGHYTMAHKPEVVSDRIVVFDEAPVNEFVKKISSNRVLRAVSSYLARYNDAPLSDITGVFERRGNKEQRQIATKWLRNQGLRPDSQGVLQTDTDDAHALAPVLLYGLLVADDLGNGWEQAVVEDVGDADDRIIIARERTSGDVFVLHPPALADALGVVGLEGMATPELWQLALGRQMEHKQVLNEKERASYLRDGLGLRIIQTATDAVKTYTSGAYVKPDEDEILIRAVTVREDTRPALISSKRALQQYDDAGILDVVEEHEHYGNLTGSNQFEGESVGIVIGSQHYGDGFVERWGALAGEVVERRGHGKGVALDYGLFGNCVLAHMRENQVLQAVLRFARGASDATVYVHTAALPSWVPIEATGSVETWSDGTKAILGTLRFEVQDEWSTADMADAVDLSEKQTRTNLTTLVDAGLVRQTKRGRGWQWSLRDESTLGTDCSDRGWLNLDL